MCYLCGDPRSLGLMVWGLLARKGPALWWWSLSSVVVRGGAQNWTLAHHLLPWCSIFHSSDKSHPPQHCHTHRVETAGKDQRGEEGGRHLHYFRSWKGCLQPPEWGCASEVTFPALSALLLSFSMIKLVPFWSFRALGSKQSRQRYKIQKYLVSTLFKDFLFLLSWG